jgi:hypothetical protein
MTPSSLNAVHFILHRRRAGKIARLPKPVREQINRMLQDGVPYAGIIASLGEAGKGLNKDNMSRWRKADHQDWLTNQTWHAALGNRPEPPAQTKQLALLLHDMDADTLVESVSRNPAKFVPVMNAVARLLNDSYAPSPSAGRTALASEQPELSQIQPNATK